MRSALLALVMAGCSEPQLPTSDVLVEPEVRAWVTDVTGDGGTLVAQFEGPTGTEPSLFPPISPQGLQFQRDGEPRVEVAGNRSVLTQTYTFTGDEGSYVITGPGATWGEMEEPVMPPMLFVDIGVDAPGRGELVGITDPTAIEPFPMGTVVLVGGVGVLVLAGLVFAFRPRREPPPEPPVPPHLVALRAWDAAKRDPSLDDNARALAISSIFRTYAEAVLAFPATSWTTSEILAYLRGLEHLADANVPRARELLRATDRVKFADEDATDALFERLGADLEAFVESTRPRRVGGDS